MMRTPRPSSLAGCHCCRHSVVNDCQRFSASVARGGNAGSRRRKIATIDSAVAPVIAPIRARIDANQVAQPGGNSPGGRSGRSDLRLRRRSASISSVELNVMQEPFSPAPAYAALSRAMYGAEPLS